MRLEAIEKIPVYKNEGGMINTTRGPMDEHDRTLLEKRTGTMDNENEYTRWVEFWYIGDGRKPELVHRSAHVHLKKNVIAEGIAAMLG
jgi:hypothetical protein